MKSNPSLRFHLLTAALICMGLSSLISCSKSDEKDPVITDEIELAIRNMSLRQKVDKFILLVEAGISEGLHLLGHRFSSENHLGGSKFFILNS